MELSGASMGSLRGSKARCGGDASVRACCTAVVSVVVRKVSVGSGATADTSPADSSGGFSLDSLKNDLRGTPPW
jgi:hypothetical protein